MEKNGNINKKEKSKAGTNSRRKDNITSETKKVATVLTKEANTIRPKYTSKVIIMPALAKLLFKPSSKERKRLGT